MEDTDINHTWRKSSFSGGANGSCVEVGNGANTVLVRDTTNREAGHIEIAADSWQAFINAIRA
jgi:hypothetical protein